MFQSPRSSVLARRLLALAFFAYVLKVPAARAQSEISDVHIQPRVQSMSTDKISNRGLNTIHTHAELVLVPVTVTDTMNRVVVGLTQGNFQLYEGKQSQEIRN